MLYIIGTPLGNSEDISFRALKTLARVDVILAEDTRTFHNFFNRICSKFNLELNIIVNDKQKMISYHDKNEFKQAPYVLRMLEKGADIALVSESGMPLISDPGSLLVREVVKKGYKLTVIPGPTAFTTAAVLSGFDISNLLFIGFLPKKESKKLKILNHLIVTKDFIKPLTICFYESPHRIQATLQAIDQILPDADICIARELTKKFEEVVRGKATELLRNSYKGELTVVIEVN